jgi:hypothetical protein
MAEFATVLAERNRERQTLRKLASEMADFECIPSQDEVYTICERSEPSISGTLFAASYSHIFARRKGKVYTHVCATIRLVQLSASPHMRPNACCGRHAICTVKPVNPLPVTCVREARVRDTLSASNNVSGITPIIFAIYVRRAHTRAKLLL